MKALLFPVLLIVGCLMAGLYGALHNQISYTVSPDYFHAFKFEQFRLSGEFHNRLGASIVGWCATWWMGLVIGIPVLLLALIMPGWKTYLTQSLVAILVVVLTALAIGLAGLAWASWNITASDLPGYWYPEGVADKAAFARGDHAQCQLPWRVAWHRHGLRVLGRGTTSFDETLEMIASGRYFGLSDESSKPTGAGGV
jgi:hypothetical protein